MSAFAAFPVWVWILLLIFLYVLIKNPDDGLYLLSLPAKFIAGLGDFVMQLVHG